MQEGGSAPALMPGTPCSCPPARQLGALHGSAVCEQGRCAPLTEGVSEGVCPSFLCFHMLFSAFYGPGFGE